MKEVEGQGNAGGAAIGAGGTATAERPAITRSRALPPWRVLLHDDDVNDMNFVTRAIQQLTPLRRGEAWDRMIEAHRSGVALLLVTHREHAELLQEQFTSLTLTVSIEASE